MIYAIPCSIVHDSWHYCELFSYSCFIYFDGDDHKSPAASTESATHPSCDPKIQVRLLRFSLLYRHYLLLIFHLPELIIPKQMPNIPKRALWKVKRRLLRKDYVVIRLKHRRTLT
jgi:hypothetical protein